MKTLPLNCKFLFFILILLCGCSIPSSETEGQLVDYSKTVDNLQNTILAAQAENMSIIENIRAHIRNQVAIGNRKNFGLLDSIELVKQKRGDVIFQILKREDNMKQYLKSKFADKDLKKKVWEYWYGTKSEQSESIRLKNNIFDYLNGISSFYNSQIKMESLTNQEKEIILKSVDSLMEESCNCSWEVDNNWAEQFFSDNVYMNIFSLKILELYVLKSERLFLSMISARVNNC